MTAADPARQGKDTVEAQVVDAPIAVPDADLDDLRRRLAPGA